MPEWEWEWEWVDNVRFVRPRGENAMARSIPAGERDLEVLCRDGQSRRRTGGFLVASVADDVLYAYKPDGVWPRPTNSTGVAVVPECRCRRHHKLDLAKIWEAADRLRRRPKKARRVDVRSVATPL